MPKFRVEYEGGPTVEVEAESAEAVQLRAWKPILSVQGVGKITVDAERAVPLSGNLTQRRQGRSQE